MIKRSIPDLLEGRPLVSVSPDQSVRDACTVLAAHDTGAVAVMQGGKLAGILSERDVIRKCICAGRPTAQTAVSEIMTANPVTIRLNASVADALQAMLDGGFRHLPVMNGPDEVAGVLAMRDIPTENRLLVERYREYTGPSAA